MANLYLDGIFDRGSASPSTVRIWIPRPSPITGFNLDLCGLLIGDPTFSLQNKWGPIISDISNLTDVTSLMGTASIATWISASTNCWKGTAPISLNVSFYLINYKSTGLNFEEQLKQLGKLAALGKGAFLNGITTTAHGGYQADVWANNETRRGYFTTQAADLSKEQYEGIDAAVEGERSGNNVKSTVQVDFGNKIKIPNLLLVKLDVTKSAVEVANSDGTNVKPLYYKVDAMFTGVAPAVDTEVEFIFNN